MKHNEPILKIATLTPMTVHTGQPLSDVRKIFSEHSFHHLPVVSGEKLVGILSSTDMLRLSFSAFGTDERAVDAVLDSQFSIESIMTKSPKTLSEKSTVRDAAALLASEQFHSLPIVDDAGALKGIVTSSDLIRYLYEQF